MADLKTLIEQMLSDGSFATITANPLAQFGAGARNYLGASILPERAVPENAYRETNIRYRTVIANSGTRYSPAQKKGGISLVGEMLVETGSSDILAELTGRDFDSLQRLLRDSNLADAQANVSNWVDTAVVRALVEYNEAQRWQAIVDASVVRTGQNGYDETISYPNPSGHRAAAGGTWTNDSYDPFDDILAMANLLDSKGYRVTRIITSTPVMTKMAGNAKVATRTGSLQVSASGTIEVLAGFATRDSINNQMVASGLPAIEVYDLTYRTEANAQNRFLADGNMVFVAETGQDQTIVFNDALKVVPNAVGYVAVGRAAGMQQPGRALHVEPFHDKPPRVEAQGWQESLPVITEPEAIAVITGIA